MDVEGSGTDEEQKNEERNKKKKKKRKGKRGLGHKQRNDKYNASKA